MGGISQCQPRAETGISASLKGCCRNPWGCSLCLLGWRSGTPHGVAVGFSLWCSSDPSKKPLECRALPHETPSCFFVHPPARSSGLESWSRALAAREQGEREAVCLPRRNSQAKEVAPAPTEASWTATAFQARALLWDGWAFPPCAGDAALAVLGAQTLPKGTEWSVLAGGKGWP